VSRPPRRATATNPLARLNAALIDRYTIERELGRGGMATVYLAEDLKHHRKVAVKVLRPELAAALGPERFLREIAIAAPLNHPHILPLLDSGDAAGLLYYVMPYVAGESLRERLNRERQLPIDEALQIAREVADALSYAHRHDVVHRDIKPENILLESGHAVVADFGIARAITAAGSDRLTDTGIAVGTPAYMSPEQSTGEQVIDGRSDLYSLGCVLYEMLVGETPYTGPTAQAILAKKLSEPLPRVSVVRETVPAGMEAALTKALARTPADRYRTAAEFVAALAHPEAMVTPSGAMTWPGKVLRRLPRWVPGVAGLAAVGLLVSQWLKSKPLNITISDITPVTTERGVEFQPAISPDGKEVAYVVGPIGAPHLVIRKTANVAGGGEARPADSSLLREWYPSWSPDGEFVRFLACRATGCVWNETGSLGGAVRSVPLPQRVLTRVVDWPGLTAEGDPCVAWAPEGARVAFVVGDTIFTSASADTTTRSIAVHRTRYSALHSLSWSPDGKVIAYVNGNPLWRASGNVARSSLWIVDASGGEPQRVTTDDHLNVSPAWLDARHLLFVSDRDGPRGVYVVEVGPHGSRGQPRLVPGVADPHSISYSTSARKLAYAKFSLHQNIWAYPLGRATPISIKDGLPVTSGSQVIELSDLSPDGRWLAFDSNRRERMDLYKVSLGGGDAVPLTSLLGDEMDPRWSPDGREIAFHAFASDSTTISQIMVMPAAGGPPAPLTNSPGAKSYPVWSPNGLQIAFRSNRTGSQRIWLLSRDGVGGAWRETGPFADCPSVLSDWAPDGSGVLCDTDLDLVLVSPEGRELWRRNLIPTSGLISYLVARYARDGRTIYVAGTHRDGRQGVWAIPVAGGALRLVIASDEPGRVATYLSVGPDRLYLAVSQYDSDIFVMNLRY